jgi:hypothetical protein
MNPAFMMALETLMHLHAQRVRATSNAELVEIEFQLTQARLVLLDTPLIDPALSH